MNPRAVLDLIRRTHIWMRTRSPYDDVGAGPAETAAIIAGLTAAALGLMVLVQSFVTDQSSILGG